MKHLLAMAHSKKHFQKLRHLQHQAMLHAKSLQGTIKQIAHAQAVGGAAMKKEGGGKRALKFKM